MIKKSLFLLAICSLLCSCWSRRELTDLAIVSALAIDKVEDEYILTVQVISPGDIAGKTQTSRVSVSSYQEKGESIFEATRKLSKTAPRRLYYAHLRMVVLGENLAKEGISRPLEFISRDHEFRTDFYIVVSKNTLASDILNVLTPVEKNPANKVFSTIDVSNKNWAPTAGVKLDELISKMTTSGSNPVLTAVLVQGDKSIGGSLKNVEIIPSPTTLSLDNIAVFKNDRLVGWLEQEESKGYNYITDNVKSTVAVLDWEDGKITLEFINSSTDLKVSTTNGTPKVVVNVSPEAQIGEVQANINLTKEENIKKVEDIVNERGTKVLEDVIQKAKDLETDIFGFGEAIHREDPKLWKKLKENWDDEGFSSLEVQVNFDTTIRRLGTTNESFLKEMEGN